MLNCVTVSRADVLVDNFIVKACEILNLKKFFYSNHLEAFRPKIVLDEIMSMNWHSILVDCVKKKLKIA